MKNLILSFVLAFSFLSLSPVVAGEVTTHDSVVAFHGGHGGHGHHHHGKVYLGCVGKQSGCDKLAAGHCQHAHAEYEPWNCPVPGGDNGALTCYGYHCH